MKTADASRMACPFGVAPTCLTHGCVAWECEIDEKRRIDISGVDESERVNYAETLQRELLEDGFEPAPAPNTYVKDTEIHRNWVRSSGRAGDCRRLKKCGCGR